MRLVRIADRRHPVWDGTGASLIGGRWNSPGRPAIYAAQSFSGAMLEILVHSNTGNIPLTHQAVTINVPEHIVTRKIEIQELPDDWNGEYCAKTRTVGDDWLSSLTTVILLVPSAVVQSEWNAIINPAHPDFPSLVVSKPVPVVWDQRLFARPTRSRGVY